MRGPGGALDEIGRFDDQRVALYRERLKKKNCG
jgi:hypothetical protein